ncbi:MAG: NAD-dependent epimerase/dehydratase family protein [bacterium]|nr:NAD-dependent epimerase/dehydratase family protein [bacterium]
MTARVLVTGGLGFIGYHLCHSLLESPDVSRLTIVDNLSSTRLDYSDLEDHAEIIIDDMRNVGTGRSFDEIYHLASPVGSVGILKYSGMIAGDIIGLAERAAELAEAGGSRLLYVSSSEVYGRDGSHDEGAPQIVPCRRGARMEYALGKLTAEHVLLNRATARDLDVRIARPFNAMGEWQSARIGFVVPRFFEAALTGRPLTVFGDGTQRRSFCHVSDIVDGITAVHERGQTGHVYNVGNRDNVTTIQDLAETIRTITDSESAISLVDPTELYGPSYIEAFDKIPDVGKVADHTGWSPRLGLQQSLDKVHGHYVNRRATDLVPGAV